MGPVFYQFPGLKDKLSLEALLEGWIRTFSEPISKLSAGYALPYESGLVTTLPSRLHSTMTEAELLGWIPQLAIIPSEGRVVEAKTILPSFPLLFSVMMNTIIEAEEHHSDVRASLLELFDGSRFIAFCVSAGKLWVLSAERYNNSWNIGCGPFDPAYKWGTPLKLFPLVKEEKAI